MKILEDRIRTEGTVLPGDILKVGSFLNQQIDVELLQAMGQEAARLFAGEGVTRVLTVEASGIALATMVGLAMHCPVVFAKKQLSGNLSGDLLQCRVHSYTHNNDFDMTVTKAYLPAGERVLLVDDFLANGEALRGLSTLVEMAGATVVGALIAVEKGFQGGGDALRKQGMRIESLARIASMSVEDGVRFVR